MNTSLAGFGLLLAVSLTPLAHAGDYTRTRYPVVLVPGVLGFEQVLGIDYWYQIPQTLRADGAKVYVTSAATMTSTEARGEQLLAQVEDILAITGAAKLNLVGHSHGGLAARYVAGVLPTRVGSVTTISSPHQGSAVADLIRSVPPGSPLEGLAAQVGNALMGMMTTLAGNDYDDDVLGQLNTLTTAGVADFNRRFPAGVPTAACGEGSAQANGQRYYSWGGAVTYTNPLDPLDPFFAITGLAFKGEANDGLVSRCSNHFGKVLRDNYAWNHPDEVNHLFGLRGLFSSDPKAVYRQHANRLKLAGL